MEKHLIEATTDGVAILTLNRPDRLNALSTPIMDGLLEALPRLAARRSGRCDCANRRRSRVLFGRRCQEHGRRSVGRTHLGRCGDLIFAAGWKCRGCCMKFPSRQSLC